MSINNKFNLEKKGHAETSFKIQELLKTYRKAETKDGKLYNSIYKKCLLHQRKVGSQQLNMQCFWVAKSIP